MKARTKIERLIVASNEKLTTISPKIIAWAIKNVGAHYAFRTAHSCFCGDCGAEFTYKGRKENTHCPYCHSKLHIIKETRKRKLEEKRFFSFFDICNDMQIQRVFLLRTSLTKGKPMVNECEETCRLWLNAEGKVFVTARKKNMGYYYDSFNYNSNIDLRMMNHSYWIISNNDVYPHYRMIKELRRNGMKRNVTCHPMMLMRELLKDSRIETMMKKGEVKMAEYFIYNPKDLDICWRSIKVANKNKYHPEDLSIWVDTVKLLKQCNKDILNPKYVCPKNLLEEHAYWLNKYKWEQEKKRKEQQIMRAKEFESRFLNEKSRYFGFTIKDNDLDLTISVLDSLEAFMEEGKSLHHCVFDCEYYTKKDSLILSARDKHGNRIETIEFSLREGKVIQCRGLCNKNTEYHERIIQLVNDNAKRILTC